MAVGEEALGEGEGGGIVSVGLDVGDAEVGVVVFYGVGAEGGFGAFHLGGLGGWGWEGG